MQKKSPHKKVPKLVKIILIIIIVFAAIRVCLEIPALPYHLRPSLRLSDSKILYIKQNPESCNPEAVYLKIYTNDGITEELIYSIPKDRQANKEDVEGGLIVGEKPVIAVWKSKDGIYVYKYSNGELQELAKLKKVFKKMIKMDDNTVGIFYYDKFKIIDINGNTENNKEIALNIIDQSDRDYSTAGFSEKKMISVKEGNLHLHTFTYDKNNNTIAIRSRFKGYEKKMISCSLLQDNSCKAEEESPNENIITADKPNISTESNTIYRSAHGYYDFFRTWYIIHSIVKEDNAGNKIILDKVVSTNFLDLLGEPKSYAHRKMSANKDYALYTIKRYRDYCNPENLYALDLKTKRKVLIEKNAISLYME